MIYKRTWLSCLLWALFSCVTGAMLAVYTVLFWKNEISPEVGYYTVGFGVLVYVLFICGCILIRKAVLKHGKIHNMGSRASLILGIAVVLCIYTAGLAYRIYIYMWGGGLFIEETEYYRAAFMNTGGSAEMLLHGASCLYTFCLSFVFSFLGRNGDTAVLMQIFIQMLTLLLAYFVVKKLVGKAAACIAMLMLAVSTVYINQIFVITPECMFFALYLIGMLAVGSYVKSYCNNRLSAIMAVCGAVFSGIVIGSLIYLDAVSLTLLILLPGLITGIRKTVSCNGIKSGTGEINTGENISSEVNKSENDITDVDESELIKKNPSLGFSVLVLGITIVTAGLVIAGIFAADAYVSETGFINAAQAWLDLYMAHLPVGYIFYQSEYSIIECYVQVILAALLIISFWNRKKTQNAAPWIFMMLLLAPTPLARVGVLPYQVFSIFIWSALAGIGLQQSFVFEDVPVTEADAVRAEAALTDTKADEVGAKAALTDTKADEAGAKAVLTGTNEDTAKTEKALTDSKTGTKEITEVQKATENADLSETVRPVEASGTSGQAAEPRNIVPAAKPRFIENPLPLPKKHERKEMDFQYEIPEDKMKFDIDIKENDDFDV